MTKTNQFPINNQKRHKKSPSTHNKVPQRPKFRLFYGSFKMITKELAYHINPILDQPSKPIHPVSLPLPFIEPAITPIILAKTLSLIMDK